MSAVMMHALSAKQTLYQSSCKLGLLEGVHKSSRTGIGEERRQLQCCSYPLEGLGCAIFRVPL